MASTGVYLFWDRDEEEITERELVMALSHCTKQVQNAKDSGYQQLSNAYQQDVKRLRELIARAGEN